MVSIVAKAPIATSIVLTTKSLLTLVFEFGMRCAFVLKELAQSAQSSEADRIFERKGRVRLLFWLAPPAPSRPKMSH